jgi:REP element-mobilizing transposase RayT
MTSHLHIIFSSQADKIPYEIMQRFKMFTTRAILNAIKEGNESRREWMLEQFSKRCNTISKKQNYKLWRNGYHAKELRSSAFIYEKLNYIHANPVAEGIVVKAEDYLFSSARNYAGLEGMLDVVLVQTQLKTVK